MTRHHCLHALVPLMLVAGLPALLSSPAWAAEERPLIAFLGVYADTDDARAETREIEKNISTFLAGTNLRVRTLEDVDSNIGRARRLVILSSSTPAMEIMDSAASIAADHVLLGKIVSNSDRRVRLTLVSVVDGTVEAEVVTPPADVVSATRQLLAKVTPHEPAPGPGPEEAFVAPPDVPAHDTGSFEVPAHDTGNLEAPAHDTANLEAPAHDTANLEAPTRDTANLAATISFDPPARALADTPLVLDAIIQCAGTCQAIVFYRAAGVKNWSFATMNPAADGRHFRAALPPMPVGQIEYYIDVTNHDLQRVGFEGTEEAPRVLPVVSPPPPAPPPPLVLAAPPPPAAAPAPKPAPERRLSTLTISSFAVAGASAVAATVFTIIGATQRRCITVHECSVENTNIGVAWTLWGTTAVAAGLGGAAIGFHW